ICAGMTEPADPGGGRFLSGVDHWRHHKAFARFATASPLPAIAGTLLVADRIHLYEDSLLVKEPGTVARTAFHQDLGYFHLSGDRICTTWAPLDEVDAETGAVSYLRGSHRSGVVHRPNWFVDDQPLPGTGGEPVPTVRPDDPRLVRFDTVPGDLVVHHAATLHGAGPNRSTTRRRRAVSVRYCGDGVRYEIRPGAPAKAHHVEVRSGDPVVDHPGCPEVWRRPLGSD
ncbi:MAG: phytanoyl-CoA dioxygenase family protein, partial [Acidimicrobiales bacterium]|nr:phytanoyl-CoA dioxygenase family protein [Acidimicrobiales bacterium]